MATAFLNFHGPISHPATMRLRNAVCSAVNEMVVPGPSQPPQKKYDSLTLLINSSGGSLDDGISLYNLFKTVPLKVTTVNMGLIASIANVVFLAGEHRIACPHSHFHFHAFDWNYPQAHQMTRMQFDDHTQLLDAARHTNEELLKLHTSLTDTDFKELQLLQSPVVRDSSFAKEKGIVQEVGFPNIPATALVFNVEY